MEARVKALEDFAGLVRERLARIETAMATKEDVSGLRVEMHKAFTDQTWRFVGALTTMGLAIIGAMVWIAKNIH